MNKFLLIVSFLSLYTSRLLPNVVFPKVFNMLYLLLNSEIFKLLVEDGNEISEEKDFSKYVLLNYSMYYSKHGLQECFFNPLNGIAP